MAHLRAKCVNQICAVVSLAKQRSREERFIRSLQTVGCEKCYYLSTVYYTVAVSGVLLRSSLRFKNSESSCATVVV